jgi:hypothetical protein
MLRRKSRPGIAWCHLGHGASGHRTPRHHLDPGSQGKNLEGLTNTSQSRRDPADEVCLQHYLVLPIGGFPQVRHIASAIGRLHFLARLCQTRARDTRLGNIRVRFQTSRGFGKTTRGAVEGTNHTFARLTSTSFARLVPRTFHTSNITSIASAYATSADWKPIALSRAV